MLILTETGIAQLFLLFLYFVYKTNFIKFQY